MKQDIMLEINKHWASVLRCSLAQVSMPGISIVPKASAAETVQEEILIVKSRLCSIIEVPITLVDQILPALNKIPRLVGVSAKRLVPLLDQDLFELELRERCCDFYAGNGIFLTTYLKSDCVICPVLIKNLPFQMDWTGSDRLRSESGLDKQDTQALGCFIGNDLQAAATISLAGKRIMQVEIFSDQDHLKKEVLQALLSEVSRRAAVQDKILRIRCRIQDENTLSFLNVSGFSKLHTLESLVVCLPEPVI